MAEENKDELTDKQKLFCHEYMIDLNGKQAAIRAGYSEDSAAVIASQNLTKLNVKSYISELKAKRTERCDITADMIIKELKAIGFSRITDYLKVEEHEVNIGDDETPVYINRQDVSVFDTDLVDPEKIPAIAGIKMGKNGIEVSLHNKLAALESLGKHIGFYEKDNGQKGAPLVPPQLIVYNNAPPLASSEDEVETPDKNVSDNPGISG